MVGLTYREAKERLNKYGPNAIYEKRHLSLAISFFSRFKSPLLIVLILAAGISGFLGDKTSAILIAAIITLSVILDFINTYRSENAAEKLKERVKITATVLREKKTAEIALSQIVPGDIVLLKAGDIVPADGKIVEAVDLFLNESTISGESFPKNKQIGDMLIMGTSVISGDATLEVTATGKDTKFSQIAQSLGQSSQETEFDRGIKNFSAIIVKVTVLLVVAIFIIKTIIKRDPLLDSLLFGMALAVGLTPELLPMIITLNLTKGSLAMAKKGVIVKKLSSIQNFGSMDILCTDKTGTLTEDKIALVKYVDGHGNTSEEVLFNAYLCSYFKKGFTNPLDEAIKEFKHLKIGYNKKIEEIPFDFERKRDSIVVENAGGRYLITKGAPEEILNVCKFNHFENKLIGQDDRLKFEKLYNDLSEEGYRVLAIAIRPMMVKDDYISEDEKDMIFLGYTAFLDPAKASVSQTLKKFKSSGIEIKIVTGDNDLVTKKIASDINLEVKGILIGEAIEKMSDYELLLKIEGTTIFSRMAPEQKKRIINLLQQEGHVVGYMGDGINDVPSLKAADIGISVNNATDVAKDTADLVLMHKSLQELAEGIIEGRKTFVNTLKYLRMTLSSNFGNMFSMAAAAIYLPFLPMVPVQILLNNLLYDSSQLAIPLDNVDQEDVSQPRKLDIGQLKKYMLVFGSLSSVFDFITFAVMFLGFRLVGSHFQTAWFIESFLTQALVVLVIRTRKRPFSESRPHYGLMFSILFMTAMAFFLALNQMGSYFNFSKISAWQIGSILLIVCAYLIAIQYAKKRFFKHYDF